MTATNERNNHAEPITHAERRINVATIQMDVRPAHTDLRLYRADQIIQDAVQLGAELVVLPEVFNTGYAYALENFSLAEPAGGPTVAWLKRTARRMGVHLAGSLLLAEGGEIYNAMFIVSPDGRTWRYDKSYPWAWEQAYFRRNPRQSAQRAVIAKTDLGNLGMLVCWDAAHRELWQAYAGQVDLQVICSSPPDISNGTFRLPPDIALSGRQLGPLWAARKDEASCVFRRMLEEQAAWLGVPVANSASCGTFESLVPNGRAALLGFISSAPGLVRYLPRAGEMQVCAGMVDACRIVSADGKTLAHREQSRGEGFALAEVNLPAARPIPRGAQPPAPISRLTFFISDTYLPSSVAAVYKEGIRNRTRI